MLPDNAISSGGRISCFIFYSHNQFPEHNKTKGLFLRNPLKLFPSSRSVNYQLSEILLPFNKIYKVYFHLTRDMIDKNKVFFKSGDMMKDVLC